MSRILEIIRTRFGPVRRPVYSLLGIFLLAFIVKMLNFSSDKRAEDYNNLFHSKYNVLTLKLPSNLNFAGEKVPLQDFMVAEAMDRELTSNVYFQSQTLMLIKRANRWFPVIEPILKKNGIPDDFKYIPLIESNLTNAVSPKGATGFWQLMEDPARYYGLEVTSEVDERYSVEKSTEAICRFIKDGYAKYKSWTMTVACLNYGFGSVDDQVQKQRTQNYYELLFPEETTRYVFRILALKCILSDPKQYGYVVRKSDLYPPIRTFRITIDSAVKDFAAFAQKNSINYKTLKYFNPWLRQTFLTNAEKKKYELILPKGNYNEDYFSEQYEYEKNLSADDSLKYFTGRDSAKH